MRHLLVGSPRYIFFVFLKLGIGHSCYDDSCQKRVSTDQCHMIISRAQVYN